MKRIFTLLLCLLAVCIPIRAHASSDQRAMWFFQTHLEITGGVSEHPEQTEYPHWKPVDFSGSTDDIDSACAPFDCQIVYIDAKNSHTVAFESLDPVSMADGSLGYVTFLLSNSDDIGDLAVGDTFTQGSVIYQAGTSGEAGDPHIHLETAKGKYSDEEDDDIWAFIRAESRAVLPNEVFYLYPDTTIQADGGYTWETVHVHSYDTVKTIAPTCSTVGKTIFTCACGDSYFENVPALGHDCTGTAIAPTCTAKGYTAYQCTRCSYAYQGSYIDAKGHSLGTWTTTKAPTCTVSGQETSTCSVCGASEARPIAPLGHRWDSQYSIDLPATATQPGEMSIHCAVCGERTNITVIPATGVNNPFEDVADPNSYYYAPVLWAVGGSVTTGTDATHFSPDAPCSRAQVVTFLWRAAGSPQPTAAAPIFADTADSSSYYYDAVRWAAEQGITTGASATEFEPDATVTRGQFVTFLWRLAGRPASGAVNQFGDVLPGPDSFYYDAVLWASEQGIANGVSTGRFAPADFCTRGQTVTFLYRYYHG